MKIQEIRRALSGKMWFVHEPKFNELLAFAELACEGGAPFERFRAHAEEQLAFQAARARTVASGASGAVAVVPLYGMLTHRGSFWSMYFGGSSVESLTDQLRQSANDPLVSAIVMDVDSPGGDVEGIDELANEIYQARKQKPITAVSNSLCASAAYYLASQASEIMVSPSSLTGSIGVYTTHEDDSKLLDNMGVKLTIIKYGDNKAEGNPYEPLTDSAQSHMQDMVNTFGAMFDKAVARGRGMKADDVHSKFGQGRVFDAKKAVQLGMADKVGTFDDALLKHGVTRTPGARSASAVREHVFVGHLIEAGVNADGNYFQVFAAEKKTERVDGEDLEKSAFAYQGSDKPEDWHLPIEFSTDEKSKSHVRDAISRWDQTDMPDAAEKKKAKGRIKAAAKKYGIELADGDLQGKAGKKKKADDTEDDEYADVDDPDPDSNDDCACACAKCKAGDCKVCTCENCACDGCACDAATKAKEKKAKQAIERRRLEMEAI